MPTSLQKRSFAATSTCRVLVLNLNVQTYSITSVKCLALLHLVQQGQLARLAMMLCHWPCTTTWRAAVSALVYNDGWCYWNAALRIEQQQAVAAIASSTFDIAMSCCGITTLHSWTFLQALPSHYIFWMGPADSVLRPWTVLLSYAI